MTEKPGVPERHPDSKLFLPGLYTPVAKFKTRERSQDGQFIEKEKRVQSIRVSESDLYGLSEDEFKPQVKGSIESAGLHNDGLDSSEFRYPYGQKIDVSVEDEQGREIYKYHFRIDQNGKINIDSPRKKIESINYTLERLRERPGYKEKTFFAGDYTLDLKYYTFVPESGSIELKQSSFILDSVPEATTKDQLVRLVKEKLQSEMNSLADIDLDENRWPEGLQDISILISLNPDDRQDTKNRFNLKLLTNGTEIININ